MLKIVKGDSQLKHLKNNAGNALVSVLVIGVILNIIIATFLISSKDSNKRSRLRKSKATVINIAEAGKEHLYGLLRWGNFTLSKNSRVEVCSNQKFEDGTFTVSCSSNTSLDTTWVRSTGNYYGMSTTIETVARLLPSLSIPFPPVRGALTARSRITVKGNIEIDGRDYDTNNVMIGTGLYGVSTCNLLFLEGSATVGGNGIVPASKSSFETIRSSVSQENASVDPMFFSPEAFLGLPAGALDEFKVTKLTTPFNGIVYLSADYVGPVHFGSSSGILIVHNPYKDAELQITNGTFKGLIITDKMAKINGNALILGGVVTLCEGEVSTFGTGTALIRFSSQVLSNLEKYCENIKKKIEQVSWEQVE